SAPPALQSPPVCRPRAQPLALSRSTPPPPASPRPRSASPTHPRAALPPPPCSPAAAHNAAPPAPCSPLRTTPCCTPGFLLSLPYHPAAPSSFRNASFVLPSSADPSLHRLAVLLLAARSATRTSPETTASD